MLEVRQIIRVLWRDRAFSVTAILMFALGIGATTAMFSVVDGVLLRPLAYEDPERLFSVYEVVPEWAERTVYERLPVNGMHFDTWRRSCGACESMGLFQYDAPNLSGDGPPVRIDALRVTHDFLPTLGVEPILGRSLSPEDDVPGADPVVLLTGSFWRQRYAADPQVLGSRILVNGRPATIVGVLPEGFRFESGGVLGRFNSHVPRRFQIIRPLPLRYDAIGAVGSHNFGALVRLQKDATPEQAMTEMSATLQELVQPFNLTTSAHLVPLAEAVVGAARSGLWMLLAAVTAVLLIVCVNLSNLMLVRAARRAKDSAVHLALGASRLRLSTRALGEALLLATCGGVLGLLFASWSVEALATWAPPGLPRLDEVRLDGIVFVYAALLTTAAAAVTTVLPALRLARSSPGAVMQANQARHSETRPARRSREVLVTAEVALSAVLLVTAGLLGASFFRLMSVEKGFETEGIVSFHLLLPGADYPGKDRFPFHERLLAALNERPGIVSAGLTSKLPLDGSDWGDTVTTPERQDDRSPVSANFRFVSPGYWQAGGIRLLEGRYLEARDRDRAVGLVSESLARKTWPGESAIGKRFGRGGSSSERPLMEVIGVVADVQTLGLDGETVPIAYEPYWSYIRSGANYVIRTKGDPGAFTDEIRRTVQGIDPALPLSHFRTFEQIVRESAVRERFQAGLAGAFAGTALLLACLGIYSVVSYATARRTGEIGIRMALGAQRETVLTMVLLQSLRPIAIGLTAGLAIALGLAGIVESLLFEVSARDPLVFGGTAVLLAGVSAAACWIPARRAARVEPVTALRWE